MAGAENTAGASTQPDPIILSESPVAPKKDRRMSDEWGKFLRAQS